MTRVFKRLAIIFLWASAALAQSPSVAIAPNIHPQFLDSQGKVLANGFIFTYASGTTTRLDTFTDSSGTIANAWPISLDSTGAPSNASGTQTGIWLSNNAYRFCAQNSALVQQWCVDAISAYSIINNAQNVTLNPVTVDPTGAAGELGYRSDLGCFRGYASFWDCFTENTAIQTLTNKTVDISANTLKNSTNTTGHYPRNNGTQYIDSAIQSSDLPAITGSYANSSTGTGTNLIAKLVTNAGASQAQTVALTDTAGAIGICISGCGASGTAQISTVGIASCVFDGATVASDYVQISSTTAGDCHDAGGAFPTANGQILGRILSTNAAGGAYSVALFGAENRPPSAATIIQPTATCSVTGTTMTNCAGMNFSVSPNTSYRVACWFDGNATTGGQAQFQWTGPAAPTSVSYLTQSGTPPAAPATAFSTAQGYSNVTTRGASPGFLTLINGANGGTVQLQIANGTGGDGAVLNTTSFCTVQ